METNENHTPEQERDEILDNSSIYQTASHGQRFINYVVDQICCVLMFSIIGFLLILLVELLDFHSSWLGWMDSDNQLFNMLLGSVFSMLYYMLFEGLLGTTPGKELTKTMIITEDGYKPELKDIFFRSLWRQVPFNALSFLGYYCVGWHDSKTNTRVVRKDSYVPPQI